MLENNNEMTAEEFCEAAHRLFVGGLLVITDTKKSPMTMKKLQKKLKTRVPGEILWELLTVIDSCQDEDNANPANTP